MPTRRRTEARGRARTQQAEEVMQVDQELVDYDGTYLECRDLRHPWSVIGYYRNNGHVRRTLRCARCGTERVDTWTPSGGRVGSAYVHPDDYVLHGGGHVTPVAVREEVLRRATVFRSERAMQETAPKPQRRRSPK